MYNNLLIDSGCTIIGGYLGGMNILGLGIGHPYVPIIGLGGGPPNGFPSSEFPGDPSPNY